MNRVVATDLYEGYWTERRGREGDPSVLERPDDFAPFPYRQDRLTFMKMDGRQLDFPDNSFDIVSKYDKQEVANAVNTAAKEIHNRYDFKGVGASVELAGVVIRMAANSEERCKAVLDVVQTWLVKRGVSLKHLDVPEAGPRLSGKEYKLDCALKEGISQEHAKKIGKLIRDEGPKGVKVQVQGDELRVASKKRDDLQAVIALVKQQDYDIAVQFTNYR